MTISKEREVFPGEWKESYRPVRQRTVRAEITKGKAGTVSSSCLRTAQTNVLQNEERLFYTMTVRGADESLKSMAARKTEESEFMEREMIS